MVCLTKPVLEAALGALKNLCGDQLAENLDNRYFTIYISIIQMHNLYKLYISGGKTKTNLVTQNKAKRFFHQCEHRSSRNII